MEPNWKAHKTDANALSISVSAVNAAKPAYFLLTSDRHHDNPLCRRDLEYKHMKQVIERGAGIIDIGDLFCAMQGKYDLRSDKSALRPEHQSGDYLDRLVQTTAEDYAPYAKHWISIGRGNHETAIRKKHETDLTERLIATLNCKYGSNIHSLGYTGWIRFHFSLSKRNTSRTLWYTHGYGGGGPVTQDTIQASRQHAYIADADILLSGHVHRQWAMKFVKQRLNLYGKIERREGWYLKLPTYKDAYADGSVGFEVEKGMGPRPLGAWWLKFFTESTNGKRPILVATIEEAC